MEQIRKAIAQLIKVSEQELDDFLGRAIVKNFKRQEIISRPNAVPNEIFFINQGLIRLLVTDKEGTEHTLYFALENQFIADYSSFIQNKPSHYALQTVEETQLVVLPRSAIEWGYKHLQEGQKLGRLIAEFYFIYQDSRITNTYINTPKERYDNITKIFPNIHNRVPQHMIASYLGITSVHLSRLKKAGYGKT
jgi:CRP-like cAMP-binding protein